MKVGLFSNGQRHRENIAESWKEDMEEIVLADRLGFDEAWVSEHTGLPYLKDAMPSAELFISKAAALTQSIALGTAIRRIALYPPQLVAMEGAVCDHLTDGRYMLGVGVGGPIANHEQWGLEFSKAHAMTMEGLELIHRAWTDEEPFDFNGEFYKAKNVELYPRPVHASGIPVAVATTNPAMIAQAARYGFRYLTGQFTRGVTSGRNAEVFDRLCVEHAGVMRRKDVTATRGVYIADTDAKAFAQVEDGWKKHLAYNQKYFAGAFFDYLPPGGTVDDITFKWLVDEGMVFVGSPASVVERIRTFYDELGGFGTFLFVGGKDWGTLDQRRHMYHLMAEEVVPEIRSLDQDLDQAPRPRSPARAEAVLSH
jgi:alkanesulfonate monooxygenase SsuD/methylene tetrahydromethanopterin reductase-like flavin-dependent oxidoreductase (luciferase family)